MPRAAYKQLVHLHARGIHLLHLEYSRHRHRHRRDQHLIVIIIIIIKYHGTIVVLTVSVHCTSLDELPHQSVPRRGSSTQLLYPGINQFTFYLSPVHSLHSLFLLLVLSARTNTKAYCRVFNILMSSILRMSPNSCTFICIARCNKPTPI